MQWTNVTDHFSESQRHYKNTYLEICEVIGENLEISLFSSQVGPYQIYFSFGSMYGIVYADQADACEKREQMKRELEKEYQANQKPSGEFINAFCQKYDVRMPSDILFDEDALMEAWVNLGSGSEPEGFF